jgi:hypothetical protein
MVCQVIDGASVFDSEEEASRGEWRCEHCGSSMFEAVIMPEEEPAPDIGDTFG